MVSQVNSTGRKEENQGNKGNVVEIEKKVSFEEKDFVVSNGNQEGGFEDPVFEGSEKRIEIDFDFMSSAPRNGLRSLGREQLDKLLKLAACEIVSQMSNALFDSYVLSESSLFVYPTKIVLKTCGTTRLLNAVPEIIELGEGLNLKVRKCKYSRASFLFPKHQEEIYHDFELEVEYLRKVFAFMGSHGFAYVLGDNAPNSLQWHVFQIEANQYRTFNYSPPTMEVCMIGLEQEAAAQFFRGDTFISAQDTTMRTGIRGLVPNAHIDDFVFEPCGYSMNGQLKDGFITIHVTPEDGFSYASVEFCRYPGVQGDISPTVEQVINIFKPKSVVVAVSFDNIADQFATSMLSSAPQGYTMRGATYQLLGGLGNSMWYYSFDKDYYSKSAQVYVDSPRTLDRAMSSTNSLAKACWAGTSSSSDTDESFDSLEVDEWECNAIDQKRGTKLSQLFQKYAVYDIEGSSDVYIDRFARRLIDERGADFDMFYIFDLGQVVRLYRYWESAFPRIEPFYAVKCMPDRAMISTLAALGAGFDCASEFEVDLVLGLGVNPDRIVYANACKRVRDIRHAQIRGVNLSTFDTVSELRKIHKWHPRQNVLLRIRADDPSARCQLGNKYGAELNHTNLLLLEAKELGLNVVGVSFHVGSGATNPAAFGMAIQLARSVFDEAREMGFNMTVLDIGGGFMPCTDRSSGEIHMGGVVEAVNQALEVYFPISCGVRVIAEPGRYFAESAATFSAGIYGRRERRGECNNKKVMDYWIPDGLYGSFNSILYDHATVKVRPLPIASKVSMHNVSVSEDKAEESVCCESNVFGPTCDGLDVVVSGKMLPVLQNGDWLMFPDMGAYTIAGASNFNGINATDVDVFYVSSYF
eukprot:TRINITY_DN8490_c0_g1_i7.p1 TRINITY_DN8490_c0_g1~~TRINITY_DN8490_c0_g1_i7.p1  ORF type:complete len:865 (-),score=133.29 TRINITY_DN8490_c0_g1_i7:195-2789(-)